MASALFSAVENEDLDSVKRLVGEGADINCYSDCGRTPLHLAVENGHAEIVNELINNSADVNAESYDGKTALYIAVEQGNDSIVQVLLESINIDVTIFYKNKSPLHVACEQNFQKVVQVLLEDLRCLYYVNTTYQDNTPLHIAAKYGHKELIVSLLHKKTNADAVDGNGRTPLWVAIEKNHVDCIEALLNDSKTNINFSYQDNTPLTYAIQEQQSTLFRVLVENNANIDVADKDKKTPLHYAAQEGMLDIAKYLLEKGANVNAKTITDITPLHLAACHGSLELVTYLVENGAVINAKNNDGGTPLHEASRAGMAEIISFLISNGASSNGTTNKGSMPLHFAAQNGKIEAVKVLIQNNADIHARCEGYFKYTPLQLAVKNEKFDIAKLLIEKGADVEAIDPHAHFHHCRNGTLLHWAARESWCGNVTIRFLVENGANVNAKESDGRTPLCLAVKHHASLDVMKFLIENGADLQNTEGGTPIYWAFYSRYAEAVRLFVEHGADVNGCIDPYFKKVSLHIARDLPTVKLLIDKGANVNATDKFGKTPLHYVNNVPCAKFLVQSGANINACDYEGCTPLHDATCFHIVEFLIENGANVHATDNKGYTPLHLAKSILIAELMLENGTDINAINHDGKTVLHSVGEAEQFITTTVNVPLLVEFFVARGINVNTQDNHGNTPLHNSIDNFEVIRKLLGQGADINALNNHNKKPVDLENIYHYKEILNSVEKSFEAVKNDDDLEEIRKVVRKSCTINYMENESKLTLLHYAVQKGREEIVEFLLNPKVFPYGYQLEKVNVNVCSRNNWLPLHYAAQNNDLGIIKLLLQHGAIYNSKTTEGYTPLELTQDKEIQDLLNIVEDFFENVKSGNQGQITKYIEDETLVLNVKDENGYSPLHWALCNGHENIAELLLENGSDPLQITCDGSTALHFAASKCNKEIVVMLYTHIKKVDKLNNFINSTTKESNTAFHVASRNGFLDIVVCLLNCGAVYNIKNREGKTPLDVSANEEVTNLLRLINELFDKAKNCDDTGIINSLQHINPDWFIAVMRARNRNANTLKEIIQIHFENKIILEKISEMELLHKPLENVQCNWNDNDVEYDSDYGFGLFD